MVFQTGPSLNTPATAYNNATQLYIAGRLDEAEKAYKSLLKIWKNHPQAHHALGTLLSQKGNQEDALKHLKIANKLMPGSAHILCDMGLSYLRKGDIRRARDFLSKSLKLEENNIHALNGMGVSFMKEEEHIKAEPYLRKVLAIEPNHAGALENLGVSLIYGQKNLEEAIQLLQKAHNLNPTNIELLKHFGSALRDLNRNEDAEKLFRKALELNPNQVEVISLLGMTLISLRRIEEAYNAFVKALDLEPDNATVLYNMLSLLDLSRKEEEIESIMEKARTGIPGTNLLKFMEAIWAKKQGRIEDAIGILENLCFNMPNMEADRLFALAKLYDKQKAYKAALETYHLANNAQSKEASAKAIDILFYPKLIAHIKKSTSEEWIKNWTPTPPAKRTPVFLVGFPRSGTTLTGQILHAHPDIHVADEVMALDKVRTSLAKMKEGFRYPEDLAILNEEQIENLRELYWTAQKADTAYGDSKIFVDKFPLNSIHAGLIYRLFPDAKIIFINRHPYDCTLSCYFQHFRINTAMVHFLYLKKAAELYAAVRDSWTAQSSALPLQTYDVQYENITADFDAEVKSLLTFVGVEWDDTVKEFYKAAGKEARTITPSYEQVNKPIYTQSTYKWEKYKDHIGEMMEILKPYADMLGYKSE